MPSAAASFWPTIRRLLPLWGRKTAAVGSLIAIASPSQAWSALGGSGQPGACSRAASRWFLRGIGGEVPLEDDLLRRRPVAGQGELVDRAQVLLAARVGEPDDLEEVVPFDHAVGVVVDRLAGAGQQPRGAVVLAQDQVGVRLAALERDPHRHLAERAAGQREGAAQGLRAEVDVDAEGTALADEAVEQQADVLRDPVVLDEELLELVDDEQDPRHRLASVPSVASRIAVDVLHAGRRGTGRRGT